MKQKRTKAIMMLLLLSFLAFPMAWAKYIIKSVDDYPKIVDKAFTLEVVYNPDSDFVSGPLTEAQIEERIEAAKKYYNDYFHSKLDMAIKTMLENTLQFFGALEMKEVNIEGSEEDLSENFISVCGVSMDSISSSFLGQAWEGAQNGNIALSTNAFPLYFASIDWGPFFYKALNLSRWLLTSTVITEETSRDEYVGFMNYFFEFVIKNYQGIWSNVFAEEGFDKEKFIEAAKEFKQAYQEDESKSWLYYNYCVKTLDLYYVIQQEINVSKLSAMKEEVKSLFPGIVVEGLFEFNLLPYFEESDSIASE